MRSLPRYLLALGALLLCWQGASLWLGTALLPRPYAVLEHGASVIQSTEFWKHVSASLWRIACGMGGAWLIAYPLGLLLGRHPAVDKWIAPCIFLTYPLPKIILLPILLTLFGLGDTAKIVIIMLTTGYQILVVTRASAQHLDKRYLNAFRTLSSSAFQNLRHVILPATLPDAITALKVASGTAVAVLFMAESFATQSGLGFLIMDAWARGDQLDMFVGILAMSVLGVVLYEGCNALEASLCRWKTFTVAQ